MQTVLVMTFYETKTGNLQPNNYSFWTDWWFMLNPQKQSNITSFTVTFQVSKQAVLFWQRKAVVLVIICTMPGWRIHSR